MRLYTLQALLTDQTRLMIREIDAVMLKKNEEERRRTRINFLQPKSKNQVSSTSIFGAFGGKKVRRVSCHLFASSQVYPRHLAQWEIGLVIMNSLNGVELSSTRINVGKLD